MKTSTNGKPQVQTKPHRGMGDIQNALRRAMPGAVKQIEKAARGKELMVHVFNEVKRGRPQQALAIIDKNRDACICFLAHDNMRTVEWGREELAKIAGLLWLEATKPQAASVPAVVSA